MAFHTHVEEVRNYYLKYYPEDEKAKTVSKLTNAAEGVEACDLERMWLSVQRAAEKKYELYDDLWVRAFVEAVFHSSVLAPYFYINEQERKEIINKIENLTNQLTRVLQANQLDFHLVHLDGKMLNGFSFYEGFSEKNRALMDEDNVNKLKTSVLLKGIAKQATEEVSYAYTSAKAGKRVRETRFIRSLAQRNKYSYGKPLHAVIATATRAIYGAFYSESDIANLLNRRDKKESREKIISKLAVLKKQDYDRRRGAEADKFGIHVTTLDDEVNEYREKKKLRRPL